MTEPTRESLEEKITTLREAQAQHEPGSKQSIATGLLIKAAQDELYAWDNWNTARQRRSQETIAAAAEKQLATLRNNLPAEKQELLAAWQDLQSMGIALVEQINLIRNTLAPALAQHVKAAGGDAFRFDRADIDNRLALAIGSVLAKIDPRAGQGFFKTLSWKLPAFPITSFVETETKALGDSVEAAIDPSLRVKQPIAPQPQPRPAAPAQYIGSDREIPLENGRWI